MVLTMGKTDWSEAAMKTIVLALLGVAGPLVLMAVAVAAVGFLDARPPASREQCDKLAQQGNYKDAYDGYRALALDPKDDPTLVGRDLQQAILCLIRLQRGDEIDAFREAVIEVHKDNWRLLQAAAESYLNDPEHFGFIVAGEFHRGPHRGGGRYVSVLERDRVRALQLLVQGLERARSNPDRPGAGRYLLTLAGALLSQRAGGESWRLTGHPSITAFRTTSPRRRMMASGGARRWPRPSKLIRACSTTPATNRQ